jgi:hypothetical protein
VLDALVTGRLGRHLTLRLAYDHLSSLAIEMWLTRLLANRPDHLAATIANNVVVSRTARRGAGAGRPHLRQVLAVRRGPF